MQFAGMNTSGGSGSGSGEQPPGGFAVRLVGLTVSTGDYVPGSLTQRLEVTCCGSAHCSFKRLRLLHSWE
jgi:hypothetical protein